MRSTSQARTPARENPSWGYRRLHGELRDRTHRNLLVAVPLVIDNITDQGERSVIAEALIGISDGLRLRAVAEGVETEAQADVLRRLGYQYAQGYHFGRPMPAADLHAHLTGAADTVGAVAPVR